LADFQRTVYPHSDHPSAEGRAQDRVSSPAKDRRSANCATQPTGWQVTLRDLIWHVISRSGVVILITNCYIWHTLLYFTLLYNFKFEDNNNNNNNNNTTIYMAP